MLTIFILTAIALVALCIGFLEVRIPYVNKKNNPSEKNNKIVKETSKNIEAFYRSIRAESWLYNIQNRNTSDIA